MVWKKVSDKQWRLFINGESWGDIVYVTFKNGKTEYQGQAWNKKSRFVSSVVKGQKLTPVKAAVERMARKQLR